ncbi:MAG: GIY-YIG nuclease superfamily protein [Syntrophaceae bacterium PtaU1.Bin231]|nr:MAG: GIY-YIG nuclease superfamily protein [Syntrophaceae bacterium PtaU1.Bin231]
MKQYYVCIFASKRNGTLYVGATSDLIKRIYEHKEDLANGFTKLYRVHILVHYEMFDDVVEAIAREKQLKKWKRRWKLKLIEKKSRMEGFIQRHCIKLISGSPRSRGRLVGDDLRALRELWVPAFAGTT